MPTLQQERALFVLLPYLRPTKSYAQESRTMLNSKRRGVNVPNRASLLAICGLGFVLASSTAAQTWNQVWSDEVNGAAGTAIDTAKLKFESGILNVNNEVDYYCA